MCQVPWVMKKTPSIKGKQNKQNRKQNLYATYGHMEKNAKNARLSLLNIGAGMGTFSDYISAKLDCSIVNVEVNSKRKLTNMVIADGSRLPFKPEAFDFVVYSDVLEHITLGSRQNFENGTAQVQQTWFWS
jgi:2-polyprenyl-3-methyl-5-hydroxy-6-metoxy-1,4-benzoquinol methylase